MRWLVRISVTCAMGSCLGTSCPAYGQTYYYPNQEVRISDLPSVTAKSRHAADVLAASAETVFRDKEVCCGKNSALEVAFKWRIPSL